MNPQNVIIINEAKGSVSLYHIRVEVAGVPLWTGVYAESVERANRVAEKVFGKGKVRGRPTKVKESRSKGIKEASGAQPVAYWFNVKTGDYDSFVRDEDEMVQHFDLVMDNPSKYGVSSDELRNISSTEEMAYLLAQRGWARLNVGLGHKEGYIFARTMPMAKRGLRWLIEKYPRLQRAYIEIANKSGIKHHTIDLKPTVESKGKGPHNTVKKGSQKRYKHPMATDDPEKYIGKWETYDEPQGIGTKAAKKTMEDVSDAKTATQKTMEEGDMGPLFSRGFTNSSTGRGAVPPETEFDPKELPNPLRPGKKLPGSKAPGRQVSKTVNKSIKNKVRRPNAPVTEVTLNELFGGGAKYPYEWGGDHLAGIDVNDDVSILVGFETSLGALPSAPPGVNVGFGSITADGIPHQGIDRESLGLSTKELIGIFNTVIEIVQKWVEKNKPDRVYFIAVESMKGIYPKLLKMFVPSQEWTTSKGNATIMGRNMDVYKLERKDQVDEMVRLPIQTKFNADYEVKDGERLVGQATVTDGVIEDLMINQDETEEDFKGHALSVTLGTIIRDADLQGANLAMKIVDLEDQDMKRFLERFGFRHTGEGVFKRTAGSITPPSVIEKQETT